MGDERPAGRTQIYGPAIHELVWLVDQLAHLDGPESASLRAKVLRYLNLEAPLDVALGLEGRPGISAAKELRLLHGARIVQEAAKKFCGGVTKPEAAHWIAVRWFRYQGAGWARDQDKPAVPADIDGRIEGYGWHFLKVFTPRRTDPDEDSVDSLAATIERYLSREKLALGPVEVSSTVPSSQNGMHSASTKKDRNV